MHVKEENVKHKGKSQKDETTHRIDRFHFRNARAIDLALPGDGSRSVAKPSSRKRHLLHLHSLSFRRSFYLSTTALA